MGETVTDGRCRGRILGPESGALGQPEAYLVQSREGERGQQAGVGVFVDGDFDMQPQVCQGGAKCPIC